jgi:hypothetical protein
MHITARLRIWIYFYIVLIVVLGIFQDYWIPKQLRLSHHDARLNTLSVYNQPLYSKIYNHPLNGSFRLINQRHNIRMATSQTFSVLTIRAWFDEETDKSSLVVNERLHNLHAIQTYTARRYYVLNGTEYHANFRFITKNQPFFSFDRASIEPTTVSTTNPRFVVFYLLIALLMFGIMYALWNTPPPRNSGLGASIAAIGTAIVFHWVSTHQPLAMVFISMYALHAAIILTIISLLLLVFAPRIIALMNFTSSKQTHFATYWDGYVIILIHFIILAISIAYQDIISRGQNSYGFDGAIYFTMTEQLIAKQTVTHLEPLVTRIGIPWLVATLFPASPLFGWQIITTLSSVVCSLVMYALAREIITRPIIRIIAVVLFMMHWLAPLRYSWFHPVTLDAPLSALMLIAVWTIMQYRKEHHVGWLIAFAVNLYIGITVREVPLLFMGCLLLAEPELFRHPIMTLKRPDVQKRLVIYGIMGVAAIALYLGIKTTVIPTKTHDSLAQAYRQLMYRPTYTWVLHAWFNTSGLLLIFILFGYRSTLQFVRKYSYIAFLIGTVMLLTFISGTDKDRFLMWINPFLLLLAAYCVEANLKLFASAWSVLIVYIQTIVGRAYWETPDPGKASRVIDTTLFTHFGDNFFFLELWPHHAQDKYHSLLATQQFIWAFFFLLGMFGIRAILLRRHPTDTTQST